MKHYSFFFLLSCVMFVNARPPIIDYKSITEWCTTYLPSDDNEIKPLREYIKLGKEWAQNCVQDINFKNSAEGKKILDAMQKNIEECLRYGASKLAYEKLVFLIKYELSLNKNCRTKRGYKVLAMVYEGCLHCFLATIEGEGAETGKRSTFY